MLVQLLSRSFGVINKLAVNRTETVKWINLLRSQQSERLILRLNQIRTENRNQNRIYRVEDYYFSSEDGFFV